MRHAGGCHDQCYQQDVEGKVVGTLLPQQRHVGEPAAAPEPQDFCNNVQLRMNSCPHLYPFCPLAENGCHILFEVLPAPALLPLCAQRI